MKIFLASDHGGFEAKEKIKDYLLENFYEVVDCGPSSIVPTDDYPDYALLVGQRVMQNKENKGILICRTGIGMSIACNKVKGIRCAKVSDEEEVKITREDNDANVIALSSKNDIELMKKMVDTFLTTPFSDAERHVRRIGKITEFEGNNDN